MLRTAGVRGVVLPLTAACSLSSAWLIVRDVGPERFGEIALITTLTLLLPFADLGLSAPLVNAFATRAAGRLRTLSAVWTWLWVVAGFLVATVVLVHWSIGWDALLGTRVESTVIAAVLVLFAVAVPFGVGQRVLTGMGRVTTATALQGLVPIIALVVTVVAFALEAPDLYVLAPSSAQALTAVVMFIVVTRQIAEPGTWSPRFNVAALRAVLRDGLPMLGISAGLAVALQSHRLVLSHWSTPQALADYTLAMTIYAPAWALLAAAGLQLWSHFAGARSAHPELRQEFVASWRDMTVASVLLAAVVAGVGPVFCDLVYGQSGPTSLWLGLALLLTVQGMHLPAGMYLTEGGGLLFQAMTVLLLTGFTIPASIALSPPLGAVGPVLAMGIGIAVFQLIPCHVAVRRAISRSSRQDVGVLE